MVSNLLRTWLLASLFTAVTQASEPQTGTWGDQGDGTYRNPTLNADYPDVDVEQLGDTYYMISSKQHMCPGMVILESKDMVNWRTIGHVWPRLSWDPKYNWDRMDGYRFGVWAGDLAYHDGRWYCYQIDTTNGLYMSSAADIRGPLTEPHLMLRKTGWTDPAVCWDDAGKQAYLVCNFGRLEASVPRGHILVHGVNKSSDDLKSAIEHAGTIVVDNLTELKRIHVILSETKDLSLDKSETLRSQWRLAPLPQSDITLWLRLLPGVAVSTHHAHTQTGQHDSKFGMTREEILEAAKYCKEYNLPLTGIHFIKVPTSATRSR